MYEAGAGLSGLDEQPDGNELYDAPVRAGGHEPGRRQGLVSGRLSGICARLFLAFGVQWKSDDDSGRGLSHLRNGYSFYRSAEDSGTGADQRGRPENWKESLPGSQ